MIRKSYILNRKSVFTVFLFIFIIFLLSSLSVQADITSGLVGYWNFDEPSSGSTPTTAADSSGNGNNGTLTNGPTWTTGQVGAGAVVFEGVNASVAIGSEFIGTSPLTISAWIYPRSGGGQGGGRIVNNNRTIFGMGSTRISFTSSGSTTATTGGGTIAYGQWHHVIVTRDASGVTNFYRNSVSLGATNQNSGTPTTGTENVFLGNRGTGLTGFDGTIDEVRIYNRVLSAAEIIDIYSDTGGTPTPTPTPT